MEKAPELQLEKKHELKKENIIPLTELPASMSKKWKDLGWPVELQGSGRVLEGTKDFEIKYPLGDKFVSFAVVIHELGHLRQEEINSDIKKGEGEEDFSSYIALAEEDAYKRGWDRTMEYFPEIMEKLEKDFQEQKERGKLEDFDSFEDLYNFFKKSTMINNALNNVPDMEDEKREEAEYEALKKAGVPKFFAKIEKSKVGEKIEKDLVEEFIMKMAQKIADE